ncbi:MAG: hypothetical protein CVT99_12835 [Bacteroidetes bacterium HGW-Bacteroidetes-16]|jgi:hypothetical protein|nr:MAG: hypothetical protein CVT99_12835 [Bacteroidetes bacterium HGW-Bacteroidetes-16]
MTLIALKLLVLTGETLRNGCTTELHKGFTELHKGDFILYYSWTSTMFLNWNTPAFRSGKGDADVIDLHGFIKII